MTPGLWGALSAVSWGTCDFLARFTGRAAGYVNALLGMLLASSVFLSLWLVLSGADLVWTASSVVLLVFAGVCSLVGYLFLYWSFTRGPVSVAAPIAGSYPALVVLIAVVMGSRPSALQWLGTAITLVGVVVVARGGVESTPAALPAATARVAEVNAPSAKAGIGALPALRIAPGKRGTVVAAALAALAWAFMISATQEVAPVVGSLETIWLPRMVAFGLLAATLGLRWARGRARPAVPIRWFPVIAVQAGLDVAGYLTLYAAAAGPNPEIAAMASSAYYVITVLLGRVVLKERISLSQVGGIAMVFAGVVLLSA
jgi:drug/metabolite transporter (DMT)-like permease